MTPTLSRYYYREIYQIRNDVTLDQVQKSLPDRWARAHEGRLHFTLQSIIDHPFETLVNISGAPETTVVWSTTFLVSLYVTHLANLRLNERYIDNSKRNISKLFL